MQGSFSYLIPPLGLLLLPNPKARGGILNISVNPQGENTMLLLLGYKYFPWVLCRRNTDVGYGPPQLVKLHSFSHFHCIAQYYHSYWFGVSDRWKQKHSHSTLVKGQPPFHQAWGLRNFCWIANLLCLWGIIFFLSYGSISLPIGSLFFSRHCC